MIGWAMYLLLPGVLAPDELPEELSSSGFRGGLVVHLGCGEGELTARLRINEQVIVQGLSTDPGEVRRARNRLQSQGAYGPVSIRLLEGRLLPHPDDSVNVLVVSEPGAVSEAEAIRVLTPCGILLRKAPEGGWKKDRKPWPEEIDEWTHFLHNPGGSATSRDGRVGPPDSIRWIGDPRYSRSHEHDPSVSGVVSSRGKLFYILDEGLTGITDQRLPQTWSLVCRDGFNGIVLWKIPLPGWGWPAWKKKTLEGKDLAELIGQRHLVPAALPRRLVVAGNRLWITLGYRAPISEIDADTGEALRTFEGTEGASELLHLGERLVFVKGNNTDGTVEVQSVSTEDARIAALSLKTGDLEWQTDPAKLATLSLCAAEGRVFYATESDVIALEERSGKELWRIPVKEGLSLKVSRPGFSLAYYQRTLFFLSARALMAVSPGTGRMLWKREGGKWGALHTPELYFSGGLVWSIEKAEGYDPATGEVKRKLEKPDWLISPGHHIRCYRGNSTERFLVTVKRGLEFWDTTGAGDFMKYDWARGGCRFGFLFANGLTYTTPHPCKCYMGNKTDGFYAFSSRGKAPEANDAARRVKGSAFGHAGEKEDPQKEWPSFRHDALRSGSIDAGVPDELEKKWERPVGGRVSQPTVAAGRVHVSSMTRHSVDALDAVTGASLWTHTAGGPVDTPPTLHRGLVLFGSRDGWVTCLRGSDGELCWRFRAAPVERFIVVRGALESVWPVHGSILVQDGVAYCTAGRTSHMDGGIYAWGLDPVTGEVLHQGRMRTPRGEITSVPGGPADVAGSMNDLLVSDGENLCFMKAVLTPELEVVAVPKVDENKGILVWERPRLMATGGLLDDSSWNRNGWLYGDTWPGKVFFHAAPKSGQLLVFDREKTFAVKYYTRRNAHSPMFFPGTKGYLFYADRNDIPSLNPKERKPIVRWVEKPIGLNRFDPPLWSQWLPIRVRAMVKAGGKVVLAGPPDVLESEDPLGAFQGRRGALLRVVSAGDGSTLSEQKMEVPPGFDGMSASGGCIYVSLQNGSVACFGR